MIAILGDGDTKTLLLDEPSTGVDPESRRVMWNNIINLDKDGKEYTLILSTHSMEEAEILCDRIGWMKMGNFLCIGNPEKLKLENNNGYHLDIKFIEKKESENITNPINELSSFISNIELLRNEVSLKPLWISYANDLKNVLNILKGQCSSIVLKELRFDFTFKLMVYIKENEKSELFTNILNMKSKYPQLSEINITLDKLEDIFQAKEEQINQYYGGINPNSQILMIPPNSVRQPIGQQFVQPTGQQFGQPTGQQFGQQFV